jgi:hypothetical protein
MENNFFGTGLTAIILRDRIQRKALAADASLSEKTISRIERGEGSDASRHAIATALDIPCAEIKALGREIIQRKMSEISTTVKRAVYELSEISDPENVFYALAGSIRIRGFGYSRTREALEEGRTSIDARSDLEQVGRLKANFNSLTLMAPCDPAFKSASKIKSLGRILTNLRNDGYVLFIGADEPGSRIVHFAQEDDFSIREKSDAGPRKYLWDLTDPDQEEGEELFADEERMAQEIAELSEDPRSF